MGAGLLGFFQGQTTRLPGQRDVVTGEVEAAQQLADDRHDQVADDRVDDLAERAADDHAHRQVDGVALDGEFPELLHHAHLISLHEVVEYGAIIAGG